MKKINFYEGKTPFPDDFDELQSNAEENINANMKSLSGTGVLNGLAVSVSNSNVIVTQGKAVNPKGVLLELTSNSSVALTNGKVVLRHTVNSVGTAKNIKQETVWDKKVDTTTALIAETATDDDVVLGTIIAGVYSIAGRQTALAWDTLKDYIDKSIATAKSEAKTETKDEIIPVGFEYVQLPNGKAPKAGTYARPNGKGDVVIAEADALGWQGSWEIHEDYADSSIVFEGADNTIANDPNKTEADIPNDKGAQPFDGQAQPMPDAGREAKGRIGDVSFETNVLTTGIYYRLGNNSGGAPNGDDLLSYTIESKLLRAYGISHTAAEFRQQSYTVRTWRRIS